MGKTTNFDLEKAAEQRKAEMKDITEKLEKGVQDVFSSEQFQNLLDTMAKFPHYSVNNNILSTKDFDELLYKLEDAGYEIKRGKHISCLLYTSPSPRD